MTGLAVTITALVEGCKLNQRAAQEHLYRQYYEMAMRVALRYARDEHDVADIVTNAFLKIFKSIHSYDSQKGAIEAWIRKIVANEGLDHIKKRSRFSKDQELETIAEPAVNSAVLAAMGADEIMNMVKRLPPATHAVFVMYVVEGYSHLEIARKLQISEGTSRWHLSEARKTLQKLLKQVQGT